MMWLHFHFSLSCIGEGNGNPLQCSCLENPRDGGAWWAAVYGVAQSRTQLKRLSSNSMMSLRVMVDRKETGPSLSTLHHIKISWHQHWKCKVPTQGLRGCGGTRVRTKFSFSQGLTVNLPTPHSRNCHQREGATIPKPTPFSQEQAGFNDWSVQSSKPTLLP